MIFTDIFFIVVEQALIHLPLILGSYICVALMKVPDLSIESAFVFGALCSSQIIANFADRLGFGTLPIAIMVSLFAGALVGMTSSLLTQKAKLPHLLSSIITSGIFHGINQMVSKSYVSLSIYTNQLATFDFVPRHPELILLLAIGFLVFAFLVFTLKTQLGYSFAIYGNNPLFFEHY